MTFRQLDMFTDVRMPDGSSAVALPGVATDLPMSVCAVVANSNGNVASGQQRMRATDDVEDAVRQFFFYSVAMYGWEAACVLTVRMVAKDPNYMPCPMLQACFAEHARALREHFARERSHGRQEDYSEGEEA